MEDGWHLIAADGETASDESRPGTPLPAAGDSTFSHQHAPTPLSQDPSCISTAAATGCSSMEVASPASERLADNVLGQPFPPADNTSSDLVLNDRPSPVAALSPFQEQACTLERMRILPSTPTPIHEPKSLELDTVMSLQALSSEGSLEGFHDPAAMTEQLDSQQQQGCNDDGASSPTRVYQHGLLSWLEQGLGALTLILGYIPSKVASTWHACAAELQEEVKDLRKVLAHTKQYFSQEVTKGSDKVACVMTRHTPRATTLVPLLSLSTIVACCGLVHFMGRCQKLNSTVKQREFELSRLIVKVMTLQQALQQQRPLLRHTGIVPFVSSVMM